MAETTGESGGSGGAGSGGSQVENLVIGTQTQGVDEAAKSLDNLGAVTIKTVTAIDRHSNAIKLSEEALGRLNPVVRDRIQTLQAEWQAEQDVTKAQQDAIRVTEQRIEQGTRFEAKLAEMVATYGMTTAELQRYTAAQLGVSEGAEVHIAALEKLTEAQRQNTIQQKRDIEMLNERTAAEDRIRKTQQDRDVWEHEQRTKTYQDYLSFWEKELSAQEVNDKRYLAEAEKRVQREKEIQQERDVWMRNQRQKDHAEYESWWSDQLKGQESALEKQLKLDIDYGQKSLKQKIDTLQKIAAYQTDPRTAATGTNVEGMFGAKAVADVAKLDQMVKQYNETLGHHGKQLEEAGTKATVWGKILDNNRIRTEGIVLAHEALQGRFTRMPGSLMVMAEYFTSAGITIGAMAGLFMGVVGALGLFGYAASRGQEQAKELGNAIVRTNGYAGETRDSLEELAHTVGKVHGEYTEAYKAAALLTNSGKFTKEQVDLITKSAVELSYAFGQDVNTTVKEFETLVSHGTKQGAAGMLQVSKAVETLDEKYHFLTVSQMQSIIQLEKEGDARAASAMAIALYGENNEKVAKKAEENIGWIEHAWHGVTWAIKGTIQALADVGKKDGFDNREKTLINMLQKNSDGSIKTDESRMSNTNKMLLQQYYALEKEIDAYNAKVAETADKEQKAGIAKQLLTARAVEDVRLMKKSQTELQEALDKFHKDNDKIEEGAPGYKEENKKYLEEREAAIIAAHSKKAKIESDGRKSDLAAALDHETTLYKMTEDAAKSQLSVIEKQFKAGAIAQEDAYQKAKAIREQELVDLEKEEKAKLAILDKYKPKNVADAHRVQGMRQGVVDDYTRDKQRVELDQQKADQLNAIDLIDKQVDAIDKLGLAQVKQLDEAIAKQRQHNSEIGMTKSQIDDVRSKQEEALVATLQGEADAIDALLKKNEIQRFGIDGIQEEGVARVTLDAQAQRIYEAELARIKNLIRARHELSGEQATGAILEAQAAAQKTVDAEWKRTDKKIGDDLASAIVDGGGRGWKKMLRDMEIAFAKAVLQPILAPISGGFASYLNPTATQAGGVAGTSGGAGATGYVGMASSAASMYKAASNGFSAIGSTMGQGVEWAGRQVGSTGMTSFGEGMQGFGADGSLGQMAGYGQTASNIAGSVGGYFAGSALNSAISGQYSTGSGVMTAEKVATAVASYFNPVAGAVVGAISGLINRAFGMGPTQLKASGLKGTISDSGVSGQSYSSYHEDGGWFRSDKDWTDSKALSSDIVNTFTNGLTAMKATIGSLAETVGVGNDALAGYTKTFDILVDPLKEVKGSAAEQAQITAENQKIAQGNAQKIADLFATIGDDMAEKLVPNIKDFALAGELSSQTLQRLNDTFKQTNSIADMLGKSVEDVFGSKGLDSDKARERLLQLAGGSSNLSSYTNNYAQNFLTEAQKLAPVQKAVVDALADLGLASVTTREQFQSTVNALNLTDEKDAKLFVSLMQLSDAFALVTPATEKEARTLADIASERKTLQDQLDELTMSSTQLLNKQRDALDESNRALFDQIQAINATKAAIEAMKNSATMLSSDADNAFGVLESVVNRQKDVLSKAHDAQIKILDAQIDAQSSAVDAAKTLASNVKSALDGMKLTDPASLQASRKAAQDFIQATLNGARAGQGVTNSDKLTNALSVVNQTAGVFATRLDYLRDYSKTRNNVSTLANITGAGADVQQKMLDALNDEKKAADDAYNDQIEKLDDIVKNAQDSLNEMKGQSDSLMSIDKAVQALLRAISVASQNPIVAGNAAINNAYQQYLGRAPDAEGLSFWQNAVANGTPVTKVVNEIAGSTEAKLKTLYQSVLGRAPDAAGLSFWMNAYGPTMDEAETSDWMKAAQQDKDFKGLPSFDVGTNNIPHDMVAQLHEGEAVVPKADNRALMSAVSNGTSNNQELVTTMQEVLKEISAFRTENKAGMVAVQRDTAETSNKLKRWEGNGMPPTRTTSTS